MKRFNPRAFGSRAALASALALALAAGTTLVASAATNTAQLSFDPALVGSDGKLGVFVQFAEAPAGVVYAEELARLGGSANADAVRSATAAARQRVAQARAEQGTFLSAVSARGIDHDVLYRATRTINGVALRVAPEDIARLRQLENVVRVEPMIPDELHNSTSVPFISAPQVWSNTIGLPAGTTGQGVKIGVIDTGIDYQHASFGGTGLLADYQANNGTVIGDGFFPTAKVVGGWDFVGDAYTASNAPVPDPDPMDCNGHGSHVSGTAAGLGVRTDNTTYPGPFGAGVDYSTLKIGPGVAPGASLYALRVFGCAGSTLLTVNAIEWAVDPNDDGDFSDRLDVINMSLGSNYGDRFSSSAIAAENAAKVGVIVVASAGNAGDTYFISGAPGSSTSTITVASSVDGGQVAPVIRVDSPASIANFYTAGTASFGVVPPPGFSGELVRVDDGSLALDPPTATPPTSVNDGCQTPYVNAAAVAGKIAFIDRGSCGFKYKAYNAQLNGAIGVLIGNVAGSGTPGTAPGMADDATVPAVTIPVASVNLNDANLFRTNIAAPITVSFFSGGDTLSSFTSRGPTRRVDTGTALLKPDVAAPGSNITSVQTGVTCKVSGCQTVNASGYIPNSTALTISGTSMAAPHISGVSALLRALYPNRSVEEIKAMVMNTASHDPTTLPAGAGLRYSASRNGSGRVDTALAAVDQVTAFNADDTGAVSVAFDGDVSGTVTRTKRVRLVNYGDAAQSFTASIDTVVDAAGVSFSVPGDSSITVPAHGSIVIEVQMDATADEMDHSRDPTLATTQTTANFGAQPRHWLAEESARLLLTPESGTALRVPVYAAVYPVSSMSATDVIATGGAPTGSTTIALSGSDVCTGSRVAGPACDGVFPNDQYSLVTPFELQGVSPRDASLQPEVDLQYVGVSFTPGAAPANDLLNFGIATYGEWSSVADVSFSVEVDCGVYTLGASFSADTCNGVPDGVFDLRLFSTNSGLFQSAITSGVSGNDVALSGVIGLQPTRTGSLLLGAFFSNAVGSNVINTRVHQNQVVFLTVPRTTMKVPAGGAFRYKVSTCFGFGTNFLCSPAARQDVMAGPFTFAAATSTQGLDFGGSNNLLLDDLNGATIPVTWNLANMASNGSLGALLLHHYNGRGNRAEVAVLEGTPTADAEITLEVSDANPSADDVVTLTVNVRNTSATPITALQAGVEIPYALSYAGDNGGGAFDPASQVWNVGALAPGQTKSLNVLVRIDSIGQQELRAQIGTASPLDPVSSNNTAAVLVNAPSAADLSVSVAAGAPTANGGDDVTFTISLDNEGPEQAFNLDVSELFTSAGFEPLAPTDSVASEGSYDGSTGLWTLPSRSATAAPATLTLTFKAPYSATNRTMTLRASANSDTSDPNTQNNVDSASIVINGVPSTNPSAAGAASPSSVVLGGTSVLTVTVTPGTNPPSTGITVAANLSSIGGSATQAFHNDGLGDDADANDNIWTYTATVAPNSASGGKAFAIDVDDGQGRTSAPAFIGLDVIVPGDLSGVAAVSPSEVDLFGQFVITVDTEAGTSPASTGITVVVDASSIGGSATQVMYDDGSNGDAQANDGIFSVRLQVAGNTAYGTKSLTATINDAQGRSATASANLDVVDLPESLFSDSFED